MYKTIAITIILFLFYSASGLRAQAVQKADSLVNTPLGVSKKYMEQVSSKTEKYYKAITGKTERTLEKLARWENKIKGLLERASPATAQRLFGNNQLTFASLLQQYKQGRAAGDAYMAKYDQYRDELNGTLKYLDEKRNELDKKVLGPLQKARTSTSKLDSQVRNTEVVQQFIKERKKLLMQEAVKYIGQSKYLQKINKEAYYYAETLRNYKEIFSDPAKAEQAALQLLKKIPAFNDFLRKNSMLAQLFGSPDVSGGQSLAGLQTRAQVNNLIQQQIAGGGPNAQQQFQQNLQAAQSQLNEWKDKIFRAGGSSSDDELPGFRPNMQKTKTFWQRVEYGMNVQTQKATSYFPVTSDIGVSAGYKLSDKSVIGVGASYKLGWGRGWDHVNITNQGMGLRSYVDIKLKGSFWISGGYEQNYRAAFSDLDQLKDRTAWQQSGLIGISKVISVKSKAFKRTSMKLLWDFLSYQQVPRTQAVVFRVGYSF